MIKVTKFKTFIFLSREEIIVLCSRPFGGGQMAGEEVSQIGGRHSTRRRSVVAGPVVDSSG